jgi:hypothetical protein
MKRRNYYIRIRHSISGHWQVVVCTGAGRPVNYLGRELTFEAAIKRADNYLKAKKNA